LIQETQTQQIEYTANIIHEAHNVTVFTGAGVSTDSGIPDFRNPESGLWKDVDPMAVASIFGFKQNPQAFYDWIHPLAKTTMNAQPNAGHYAIVELETMGYVHTVITRNIDMLHTRAGSKLVYELHGHMREATCIRCFKKFPAKHILEQFIEDGKAPSCPDGCGGVLKPDVILFGEQLPVCEFQAAQKAARACDLMIIVGSSLEVAPAGDLPILASRTGAKLIIVNLEPTPADKLADIVIHGRAAEILPKIARQLERIS
jgi:NAD-dependent deacetylase